MTRTKSIYNQPWTSIRIRAAFVVLLPALIAAAAGCRSTLDASSLKGVLPSTAEMTSTGNIHGPMERMLIATGFKKDENPAVPDATAGTKEYTLADSKFKGGKYKQAEKEFKKIAKKFKDSPIREDALFMIAESQFHQNRFAPAQDSYDLLLKDFPTTRHVNQAVSRLFTIAQTWLEFPKFIEASEIQQVSLVEADSGGAEPPAEDKSLPWTRKMPILPNFTDRRRPMFDTDGRALQALKSIWLNDPTGPLADDALMMTASHYLRKGDNQEADRMFTIIREEYPKSPHLKNAFLLGSHVKLASYQGADYDGKTLEGAQQLKESTLRIFTDLSIEDRQRQRDELRKIEEATAGSDWALVEFYQKKEKPEAVAVYCREVIRKFPNTSYADRARQVLTEMETGRVDVENPIDPKYSERAQRYFSLPWRRRLYEQQLLKKSLRQPQAIPKHATPPPSYYALPWRRRAYEQQLKKDLGRSPATSDNSRPGLFRLPWGESAPKKLDPPTSSDSQNPFDADEDSVGRISL